MNNNPIFTNAGLWTPVDEAYLTQSNSGGVVSHSGLVNINGQYSVILNGWGWYGSFGGDTSVEKVDIALLTPDAYGGLYMNTSSYINDASTNGCNTVVVADFNEDGKDDIFLAAHNESPFIATNSTAYLSNAMGTFTKITLDDHVMAHDAQLSYIDGKPSIITTTYQPGDTHPIYQYNNGTFTAAETYSDYFVNGMSTTIDDFGNDESYELIRGSVMHGYNSETGYFDESFINVYSFDDLDMASTTPIQEITPYLSTLDQYSEFASYWGKNITHIPRVWEDDLNNDGYMDILASNSMWTINSDDFPTALQILINNGSGFFEDRTATLGHTSDYDQEEYGYDPTFVDIDNSGIDTYCFSSFSYSGDERQSNYVLLNDGTGHLYSALHDEFAYILPDVFNYAKEQYPGLYIDENTFPKFIAVPQTDGTLNFVAEIMASSSDNSGTIWHSKHILVNIPVKYNPTTDFIEDVSITDRNDSTLMRTWAGNDTFTDTNANATAASIDGGLGMDLSTYSQSLSTYHITANTDGSFNIHGNTIDDTLVNIERLAFSDKNIALDIDGIAGKAYRIYQAAFDRTPDKEGLGYWISEMDKGMSLEGVSNSFIHSQEFQGLYGTNPTNEAFVTLLYNNVLNRNPDAEGMAYWLNEFNTGIIDKVGALASFSESSENINNVADVIANGIEYVPYDIFFG